MIKILTRGSVLHVNSESVEEKNKKNVCKSQVTTFQLLNSHYITKHTVAEGESGLMLALAC